MPIPGMPSAVPVISIGGRLMTDIGSNLIILQSHTTGSNNTASPRRIDTTNSSGYQVPVGRTLRLLAFRATNCNTGADTFGFGYSDNDCGTAGTTTPTNGKTMTNYVQNFGVVAGVGQVSEGPLNFDIPAQKYVNFFGGGGITAVIIYAVLL